MKKYKVISIDLFQTLVNIETRSEFIWKRILKDEYTEEKRKKYKGLTSQKVVHVFHETYSKQNTFMTLREIFTLCFYEMFEEENVAYCHNEAVDVFMDEHNHSEWYEDSIQFLKDARNHYKICLLTDADDEMIDQLIDHTIFDHVMTSESVRSYKKNENGKMFKKVMEHFKCSPDEMLHIGDASSDMIGAHRLSIDTCWINRHEYKKHFFIKPTYEVNNLKALMKILEI